MPIQLKISVPDLIPYFLSELDKNKEGGNLIKFLD